MQPWALAEAVRVVERCRALADVTDVEGETTRTFLSAGMRRANALVAEWMRDAGLRVRVDAAGNVRGVHAGEGVPFVLASHLDTVPNAGAFDGVLGVVIAIALAERCGETLPFPLEVIAFSEEEGVRFGAPFLGSHALVGTLDDALLSRQDRDGVTVREAIEHYGLDPEDLPAAVLRQARGYLEFHIEQGPVLAAEGLPLGVVDGIAGQSHFEVTFTGSANHAGTTPMRLRRDALTVAAGWIAQVEALAEETTGLVATVGRVEVLPGARNVVPGLVRCTLDVRSAEDAVRVEAARRLVASARAMAEARGVRVDVEERMQQEAVPMDTRLTDLLSTAVGASGLPVRRMTSGAGHDAMVVAPHLPAAMLFLRTPGGLSHHPEEAVATEDVAAALEVGVAFLKLLAQQEGKP